MSTCIPEHISLGTEKEMCYMHQYASDSKLIPTCLSAGLFCKHKLILTQDIAIVIAYN